LHVTLLCPFTAGTVVWQAQTGAWTLTVCVKGTFKLTPGREMDLCDVQEPVAGDRHVGDDPRASLYAPSDLVPYKTRTDVLLVGSAFAPAMRPVEALVARIAVGDLDKSLGVIGDRVWIEGPEGPEPSAPALFTAMPLGYERAARAADNPVGFDLTRPPVLGALALPNLEAADDEIGVGRTVGFGPVPPAAPSRRSLLSAEGAAWIERGRRGPAPAGFDFAYHNAAPRDQQLDVIRTGATLVLENLSREHARLETRLPTVRAKAFLVPADIERGLEIPLRCDTVWIDTDRGVVSLSWRGFVTVDSPHEEALGSLVVAAESKGREVGYTQIMRLLRDGISTTTGDGDTFVETGRIRRPDLPAPPSAPAAIVAPQAAPPAPLAGLHPADTGTARYPRPVVIESEETSPPVSWEEISQVELVESNTTEMARPPLPSMASGEETKTQQRIDVRRFLVEDPYTEEPSTKPVLVRPTPPSELEAADYARIAVAVERGDAARVLFRYGLALADLPRLQRAWSDRAAADPDFGRALVAAVEAARRARS
jgi:hypothetical protein